MKKEQKVPKNANGFVELLDKNDHELEDIEKCALVLESMKENVRNWKEKNERFENTSIELEERIRFRDEKTLDIEEHMSFLNLMRELEEKMKCHKEKVTAYRASNNLRKQLQSEVKDRLEAHKQKMDHYETSFLHRFKRTKEELKKADDRKKSNEKLNNENIEILVEDNRSKVCNIEQLGRRIQTSRVKVRVAEFRFVPPNLEINQRFKEEIRYPENKIFMMQHMSELRERCSKLESWNEEYERFKAQHDQWIKKKYELEDTMKTAEENADIRDQQISDIEENINSLNRMIDAEEKVNQLRKMVTAFIDIKDQKSAVDLRLEDYVKKMEEVKVNEIKVNNIQKELLRIRDEKERDKWPRELFLQYGSDRTCYGNGKDFWYFLVAVVISDLSDANNFKLKKNHEGDSDQLKLIGPSKSDMDDAQQEIELWA